MNSELKYDRGGGRTVTVQYVASVVDMLLDAVSRLCRGSWEACQVGRRIRRSTTDSCLYRLPTSSRLRQR